MFNKLKKFFSSMFALALIVLGFIAIAIIGVVTMFIGYFLLWGLIGLFVLWFIWFLIWIVIDEWKES